MNKRCYFFFALLLVCSGVVSATENLVVKVPALTLAGAKYIAAASAKKAQAENWQVIIVVSDASGHIKYLESMDDVQSSSIETAIKKAETAVMYRRSTKIFQERVQGGEAPLTMLPNMLPFAGGLPIVVDGQVIGGVGVSGVKGEQEDEIAQAGIDAFLKKLSK